MLRRSLFTIFFLLFSRFAYPVTSASVQNFLPTVDPSPYFTVSGSKTMDRWQYHLGLTADYAKKLLINQQSVTVVDDFLMADFVAAVGLFPWLHVGFDLPFAVWNDILVAGQRVNDRGFGDLRLEAKLKIVDLGRYPVGLAFVPFFTFPTGNGDRFLGNNSIAGGGRIVFDVKFLERVNLALNGGFLVREGFVFGGTERDESYLLGLGFAVRAADWVDLIGEIQSSILAKAPFDRESETPVEADGGFRFRVPQVEGLSVTLGGGAGLTFGYGSPDFRGFAGVTYTKPVKKYVPPPPEPEPEPLAVLTREKIEIKRKVHFEYNKATIRSISHPLLDAVASLLKENPSVRKVRVEGHTDSQGTDAYNSRLSQKRAEAVRGYLIQQGAEADRLIAEGYGESKPIDTNESDLGRARNRRVEFTILEQDETPESPAVPPQPELAP